MEGAGTSMANRPADAAPVHDRPALEPAEVPGLLHHHDRSQLLFQIKEIVDERTYLRHGIVLEPGATVLDVGANVGVAAVFFAGVCRARVVHSFEPVEPAYHLLKENASSLPNCVAHPYGLSDTAKVTTITYYPLAAAMSGLYADADRDAALVRRCLENSGASSDEAEAGVEGRYESFLLECELRTLSQVLEEEAIDTVDLLKIDVERAELDVLDGIDDADWRRIRQLVVEVHDEDGRLATISERLRRHGFEVVDDQEPVMAGTEVKMIFARR